MTRSTDRLQYLRNIGFNVFKLLILLALIASGIFLCFFNPVMVDFHGNEITLLDFILVSGAVKIIVSESTKTFFSLSKESIVDKIRAWWRLWYIRETDEFKLINRTVRLYQIKVEKSNKEYYEPSIQDIIDIVVNFRKLKIYDFLEMSDRYGYFIGEELDEEGIKQVNRIFDEVINNKENRKRIFDYQDGKCMLHRSNAIQPKHDREKKFELNELEPYFYKNKSLISEAEQFTYNRDKYIESNLRDWTMTCKGCREEFANIVWNKDDA